eukprot:CAMPEP_0194771816 /NCGR_PEP_ID=MMETSP0323_2-20130528/50230_1 /TAXON_ID=2866 ORGANISM="Crypthecodinium cohnii, Strain Seligo" /NCGR_SAMPLE_ID=MMETSP0323_2 /ASSEMBLY_ACC=CAM_ASM_000346 /LENGTH=36 /DNA_ID= /DNA_START= /DNA_END= /DNA_ORIENTATION=
MTHVPQALSIAATRPARLPEFARRPDGALLCHPMSG